MLLTPDGFALGWGVRRYAERGGVAVADHVLKKRIKHISQPPCKKESRMTRVHEPQSGER